MQRELGTLSSYYKGSGLGKSHPDFTAPRLSNYEHQHKTVHDLDVYFYNYLREIGNITIDVLHSVGYLHPGAWILAV